MNLQLAQVLLTEHADSVSQLIYDKFKNIENQFKHAWCDQETLTLIKKTIHHMQDEYWYQTVLHEGYQIFYHIKLNGHINIEIHFPSHPRNFFYEYKLDEISSH